MKTIGGACLIFIGVFLACDKVSKGDWVGAALNLAIAAMYAFFIWESAASSRRRTHI